MFHLVKDTVFFPPSNCMAEISLNINSLSKTEELSEIFLYKDFLKGKTLLANSQETEAQDEKSYRGWESASPSTF